MQHNVPIIAIFSVKWISCAVVLQKKTFTADIYAVASVSVLTGPTSLPSNITESKKTYQSPRRGLKCTEGRPRKQVSASRAGKSLTAMSTPEKLKIERKAAERVSKMARKADIISILKKNEVTHVLCVVIVNLQRQQTIQSP